MSTRSCLGLFCAALLLNGCSGVPEGTVLLAASQGSEASKPCSRSFFEADRFWQATPAQAATFDEALRVLLTSPRGADLSRMVGPLSGYHKQLIGYTSKGRQYVYANLYPESDLEMPVIGKILRQW